MLPKKHRINKKIFEEILKKGKIFSSDCLYIKTLPISEKHSIFAFVVSSKVAKKAVERNKLKRRARHIIKKMLPKIEKGLGVIIFFKKGVEKMTFSELEKEINDIFYF
jgi:ribonuclease P protein component